MGPMLAAALLMVIVNTVVLVQGGLGRPQADVALMLSAYGGGSMLVALIMPKLLDGLPDRRVMLSRGIALPVLLLAATGTIAWMDGTPQWSALLGAATSADPYPLSPASATQQHRANPAYGLRRAVLPLPCLLPDHLSPGRHRRCYRRAPRSRVGPGRHRRPRNSPHGTGMAHLSALMPGCQPAPSGALRTCSDGFQLLVDAAPQGRYWIKPAPRVSFRHGAARLRRWWARVSGNTKTTMAWTKL